MPSKEEFNLAFRPKDYGPGRDSVIASIALPQTVHHDIILVKVRKTSGTYRYRIVADDGVTYPSNPKVSDHPLSLAELVAMIDGASGAGYDDQPVGLTSVFRDENLENSPDDGPGAFLDFVVVTSKYYPELERWYKDEAKEWLADHVAARAEQGQEMNEIGDMLRKVTDKKTDPQSEAE